MVRIAIISPRWDMIWLTDLMEKQNYPDQFQYPGGPPQPPYDLAGWTLPMQMGVTVDRIDQAFNINTELITSKLRYREGSVDGNGSYVFSNKDNCSFIACSREFDLSMIF